MFDISWGKLVLIGMVALVVIGPKELPAVLRTLGQWMTKMRRMAAEFQGQFQEAMREAEMADLKKQFDDTTSSIRETFDTTDIKNELEKMIQEPPVATSTPATPPSDPAAPAVTQPADLANPSTPPSDPVALGTAPVAPAVDVPMPELPPPVDTKDFAAPAPQPDVKPEPAHPQGGKAA